MQLRDLMSADAQCDRGDWVTSFYLVGWGVFYFSRRPHCRRGALAPDFADRWVHPVKTTCASALSCEPADRSAEGVACLFPPGHKPSDGEWATSGYDDATRRRFEGAFPTKKTSRGAPACEGWCKNNEDPWSERCAWTSNACAACPECAPAPSLVHTRN